MRADIPANLRRVKERLAEAAERAGRQPSSVELVVVSKTWPAEVLRPVLEAGHDLFGENKLQEAAGKIPQLPDTTRWHFIGRLQRNKVRKALPLFEVLHGIDSVRLATQVDRIAGELGVDPTGYLQVNAAGEASKGGFSPDELRDLVRGVIERHVDQQQLQVLKVAEESELETLGRFAAILGESGE